MAFYLRRNNPLFIILLMLFAFFLGITHTCNYLRLPKDHIARLVPDRIEAISLRGVVNSNPQYGQRKTNFIFRIKQVIIEGEKADSSGDILVNISNAKRQQLDFNYGDELILDGRLYKPFSFGSSGFSYREYLKNKGIYYILSVSKDDDIKLIAVNKGNFLQAVSFKLHNRLKSIFQRYLLPVNSAVLSGIILGDRQDFPGDLKTAFVQTGTAHIIAISGFNVGIIVFILLILLKVLGLKRKARYLISIPIIIIHSLAVGLSASVVRATVMAMLLLGAYLFDYEAHIINSLSLAALIILAFNPLQVFDAGFQLSFICVLGIVLLSPKLMKFFKTENKTLWLYRVTMDSLSVSLSAWLVTVWFIAYYFRIVSPVTIFANLVIVPLSSLVIILAFTLGLSAIVLPPLAVWVASATDLAMAVLFWATIWFSRLPFAYFYLH